MPQIIQESNLFHERLDQIAKWLWSNRAAVMVGSGFSKNANTMFPDWNQLGNAIYEEVYGYPPRDSTSYGSVLRVAEELEIIRGRETLDQLLRKQIPDSSSEPSDLHVALLELPWVDVFTTNYDTLLDRARYDVITRKYDVVVNQGVLLEASKPRIIKLHGSFPSHTPFVITHEDYRQYPKNNAAFVNTVQQSLIENALVLIGFSGDDPNFLEWMGWIRDNLGRDNNQKVFMIGIFNFSEIDLAVLSSRGIEVIDFHDSVPDDDTKHNAALEFFIRSLTLKRPRPFPWPQQDDELQHTPWNFIISNFDQDCEMLANRWKKEREQYPGRMILPAPERERFWKETYEHYQNVEFNRKIPIDVQLSFAYELNWRLDLCLLPLSEKIAVFFEKILDARPSFLNGLHSINSNESFTPINPADQTLKYLNESWTSVGLALIKYYRQRFRQTDIKHLIEIFDNGKASMTVSQLDAFQYEKYLYYLPCFQINEARKVLKQWRPHDSFWNSVKTLGSVGVGETAGVKKEIRSYLNEVRKIPMDGEAKPCHQSLEAALSLHHELGTLLDHLNSEEPSEEEISSMRTWYFHYWNRENSNSTQLHLNISEETPLEAFKESWESLKSERDTTQKHIWTDLRKTVSTYNEDFLDYISATRFQTLRQNDIDLWRELQLAQYSLRTKLHTRVDVESSPGFDIATRTSPPPKRQIDEEVLDGYRFLHLVEKMGIPLWISYYNLFDKSALEAARRVGVDTPLYALSTLFRIGDVASVEKLVTRNFLLRLGSATVDILVTTCMSALQNLCQAETRQDGLTQFETRAKDFVSKLLSRLVVMVSPKLKLDLVQFLALALSQDKAFSATYLHKATQRLLNSMSNRDLVETCMWIASDSANHRLAFVYALKNTVIRRGSDIKSVVTTSEFEGLEEAILRLKHNLESATAEEQCLATWAKIITICALGVKPDISLDSSLTWAEKNLRRLDEPTRLLKRLELCDMFLDDVIELNVADIKNYLLRILDANDGAADACGETRGEYISLEIIGNILVSKSLAKYPFQKENAKLILENIFTRWVGEFGDGLNLDDPIFQFERQNNYKIVSYITMLDSVSKNIRQLECDYFLRTLYNRLIDYGDKLGLPTLYLQAMAVIEATGDQENLIEKIHRSLDAVDFENHLDGTRAVYALIAAEDSAEALSAEGFNLLVSFLRWAPTSRLSQGFELATYVLDTNPKAYEDWLEGAVLTRLEYLEANADYNINIDQADFDEIVNLRYQVSSLTAALWKYYQNLGKEVPNVIELWRTVFLTDESFGDLSVPWLNS